MKQWYGLRRQKTSAYCTHPTSVLKFVLPAGRMSGVATHAVSGDSGYGWLEKSMQQAAKDSQLEETAVIRGRIRGIKENLLFWAE